MSDSQRPTSRSRRSRYSAMSTSGVRAVPTHATASSAGTRVEAVCARILNQDGDDTSPCTQELITILKRGPETLHDFDGELFGQLIDKVIIESSTSLRFRLKNGLELRESIERTVR